MRWITDKAESGTLVPTIEDGDKNLARQLNGLECHPHRPRLWV